MLYEKKIFLERDDDLKTAINTATNSAAEKIILNLPKDSVLGAKLNNFQILCGEISAAGKELVVESIDEHILQLAKLAGIVAVNPVFKTKSKVVSDIVLRTKAGKGIEKFAESQLPPSPIKEIKEEKPFILEKGEPEKSKPPKIRIKSRFNPRKVLIPVLTVVLLGFGIFEFATQILPQATIAITLKKISAAFTEKIEISTAVAEPSFAGGNIVLPGELITAKQNLQMSFPAKSRIKVEIKAKGALVIYNSFSSAAQILVKNTRFLSPEGKIFRLDEQVNVPGAFVADGKITPSKIEVRVTADEAGENYNVGSSALWRIPGFQGTPKYEGFHAEIASPFTGGFSGETAKPNEEELAEAKSKIESSLKDFLKNQTFILIKNKFKLVEDASVFNILKEEIQPVENDSEKFGVFAEAEMKSLVFSENALKEIISEKQKSAIAEPPNLRVSDFKINYGEAEAGFDKGEMFLPVDGSIIFAPDINAEGIIREMAGRDGDSLKAAIFSLPGLEKANISFWPFWVKKVPEKSGKIKVIVD